MKGETSTTILATKTSIYPRRFEAKMVRRLRYRLLVKLELENHIKINNDYQFSVNLKS